MLTSHETPDKPMRITALLAQWESLKEAGGRVDLDELCQGDAELRAELERQIKDLESINKLFASTTNSYPRRQQPADEDQELHQPPAELDRYQLRRLLGQGGFGQVWLAFDPLLQRNVAIKIPRPDRAISGGQSEELVNEARRAASLAKHKNVVKVHDVQRRGATWFIVSDFIDGESLAQRMRAGRFSFEESARIVTDVATALHHVHLHDLVHRDVKPANVLIDKSNEVYLTDFSLAATEDEQLAEESAFRGTVAYVSPEQSRGEARLVDARSDVYSLGVVLYELLTGRLPYRASSTAAYLDQIVHSEPRPPRTIDDAIPPELERICLKCLSKPISQRWTTALDLARELQQWSRQRALSVAPPSPAPPAVAAIPSEKSRIASLLAVSALILVITLLVVLGFQSGQDPSASTPEKVDSRTARPSRPPKPGVWQNLLDEKPETLIQPKSFFTSHDPGKRLTWDTQGTCFIGLGTAQGRDYEIEITLEQSHLAGMRGVFLAYQPDSANREYQSWCHYVVISPDALKTQPAVVARGTMIVNRATSKIVSNDQIGPLAIAPHVSANRFTLSVRVQDGRLAWIGVNHKTVVGMPLDGVPDSAQPLTGRFGIVANRDSAYVPQARWKILKKGASNGPAKE